MDVNGQRNLIVDDRQQPEGTVLAGYAALIRATGAKVPMPDPIAVVSERGGPKPDPGSSAALKGPFAVFRASYAVKSDGERPPTLADHVAFALRYEKLDLLALKRIFEKMPPEEMARHVDGGPTSGSRRQAWFLYEWLTGRQCPVDLSKIGGNFVDAIDAEVWNTGSGRMSPRHRVRDNLPGSPRFCPLVRRGISSKALKQASEEQVRAAVGDRGPATLQRLTRRLLLKDSKSTFQIEGETASVTMAQRWSDILAQAGRTPLSINLLEKLQDVLMSERRFVLSGLRRAGVFLGDRVDGNPVPVWIGARPEDVPSLMEGIIEANSRMTCGDADPLAQAAAIAFGEVFVHPFEDGNGRIHRYLIQHVLGERGIVPDGLTLPISKSIWQDIDGYHEVLSAYDRPRMPLIDWKPTANGNVEVTNDTADLYRFFDATDQMRYLERCTERALKHDIPNEIVEMGRRDRLIAAARDIVRDLPERDVEKFAAMTLQNGGVLSKGKRKKEFSALTDDEVRQLEEAVREVHEIPPSGSALAP